MKRRGWRRKSIDEVGEEEFELRFEMNSHRGEEGRGCSEGAGEEVGGIRPGELEEVLASFVRKHGSHLLPSSNVSTGNFESGVEDS